MYQGAPRKAVRIRHRPGGHLGRASAVKVMTPERRGPLLSRTHHVRVKDTSAGSSWVVHISGIRTPTRADTGWGSTLRGHGHPWRNTWPMWWLGTYTSPTGWMASVPNLTLQVQHYTYTCQHRQDCSHILDFYLWFIIVTSWHNTLSWINSDRSVKKFILQAPRNTWEKVSEEISYKYQWAGYATSLEDQEPQPARIATESPTSRPGRRFSPNTSSTSTHIPITYTDYYILISSLLLVTFSIQGI